MTGCFGAVDNADAEEDTTIQTTNQPPQFHVAGVSSGESPDFRDITESGRISTYAPSTGEELASMYHSACGGWVSVTDVDSNITSVGLDFNLDQVIDHQFTTNESWSDLTYHESPGYAQSNGSLANYGYSDYAQICFARFNLMAFDDEGGMQIIPYTLSIDQGVPHNAASCLDDYTGVEE